jgi:hypothetical protein
MVQLVLLDLQQSLQVLELDNTKISLVLLTFDIGKLINKKCMDIVPTIVIC